MCDLSKNIIPQLLPKVFVFVIAVPVSNLKLLKKFADSTVWTQGFSG